MKKIGFVDYYLDEWHANYYPEFFKNETDGRMEVAYAYGKIDNPNGMTNKEWSEKYNIELLGSIEELVDKSDYIIVLSPDNAEMHIELTDLPLKSGKPVFIDKTFALDLGEAIKMFENADSHNTPCYSSSALYFADELKEVEKDGITRINSVGCGEFEIYSVHQLEQIVTLMGTETKRVMYLGDNPNPCLLIEFEGGKIAQINHFADQPFSMTIGYDNKKADAIKIEKDFWPNCIRAMAEFFETEIPPVPHNQTLAVVGIIDAGIKAKKIPYEWVDVK